MVFEAGSTVQRERGLPVTLDLQVKGPHSLLTTIVFREPHRLAAEPVPSTRLHDEELIDESIASSVLEAETRA